MIVSLLAAVVIAGAGLLFWLGYYAPETELLVATDKKEYEAGSVLKVKLDNKMRQSACFSICYPYLLEHKNDGWASYDYSECRRFNGNGYCLRPGDLRTYELTLPAAISGLHRLALPTCLGCNDSNGFTEHIRFYSNNFSVIPSQ